MIGIWLSIFTYILLFIWFLPNANAKGNEENFWVVEYRLTYAKLNYSVKNLDIEIRDVPIHPEDDNVPRENQGPIERISYATHDWFSFDLAFKKNISKKFRFGIGLDWILYPYYADKALRNYTNAVGTEQRGYGAALTFVGLTTRGIMPHVNNLSELNLLWNISPEIMLEVPLEKHDFTLGFSISYHLLEAVNGWDRYDSLEDHKYYDLAHIYPLTFYVNIRNLVTIGIRHNIVNETSWGRKSNVEIGDLNFTFTILTMLN